MKLRSLFSILVVVFGTASSLLAQTPDKAAVRAKIDEERQALFTWDEEQQHTKAMEFIKRDSTYYVGWMVEGSFRYERANDAIGFQAAVAPLRKAMACMEKDFDRELRVRTSDLTTYYTVIRYQQDYCNIAYTLSRTYQNLEQADLAMGVYRQVQAKNMQNDFSVEAYNAMAWLCHRNRMYTQMKFSFLKNSPEENNKLAMQYLDSAALKYQADAPLNLGFYNSRFVQQQMLGVYWYKAILFTYALNQDSAQYYYDRLMEAGWYSSNNYANFRYTLGDFQGAEQYYQEAEDRENFREKQTREFYYMRGIIDIYKAKPAEADSLLQDVIDAQGSSPGFGWHSIGLARAKYYEGLTAESQKRLNKAARFHELHIGTTWGPEQYHLCVALYNYLNKVHQEREHLFEHDEWYYWINPVNWMLSLQYKTQEQNLRLMLASLLVSSMERGDVIYPLFTSENLMSFDEVGELIQGFSNEYFIKYFKARLETDKRPKVKKYFRYLIAKLLINEGDEDEALVYLNEIIDDPLLDQEYDRLLLARTYELMSVAYDETGEDDASDRSLYMLYKTFPQLVPYGKRTMKFQLRVEGADNDNEAEAMVDDLKDCDLEFTKDEGAPEVLLVFEKNKDGYTITYSAGDNGNGGPVAGGMYKVTKKEQKNAGKILAYRIFGIEKEQLGGVEQLPKVEKLNVDSVGK